MIKTYMTWLGLLLFAFVSRAETWTVETVPNTKKQNAGVYVSNPDGLIDSNSEMEMNRLLAQAEQATTAEVFVVALKSTGEIPIKTFATDLFHAWGIGKKGNDNGLLILMVEDQRKVSFETGYGMEGVLPDALCMRIIQNDIRPYMVEKKYGVGLLSGVRTVVRVLMDPKVAEEIRVDMQAEKAAQEAAWKSKAINVLLAYAFFSIVLMLWVLWVLSRKIKSFSEGDPYDAYKALSTSNAGYALLAFLFPLTMSFFYVWYRRKVKLFRLKPRCCPDCGKFLQRMSEQQEDVYLNAGQQSEELVGSVDYDAWVCMDCGHRIFLSYAKAFTNYKTCPSCGYKTYAQTADRVVMSPTSLSSGEGVKVYTCAHCGHEIRKPYSIPMIILPPSGGGRSNGFGGGMSGGSFGGGSSGGGGATGNW